MSHTCPSGRLRELVRGYRPDDGAPMLACLNCGAWWAIIDGGLILSEAPGTTEAR